MSTSAPPPATTAPPRYVVRYGMMRNLGVFSASRSDAFVRGDRVVGRTDRGLEVGEILCEATEHAIDYMKSPQTGRIERRLTTDDRSDLDHLQSQRERQFEVCKKFIQDLNLEMQLVEIENILGGERIVFYYLAENRVDFRNLVKMLASEFQTRIEMRQIGVRDEAKLLGDYGDCGKPLCCNTHLAQMPPVSMKMAKIQKATLDPTKISGRCGRLKCCLRYEYQTYVDLQRELPNVGRTILTKDGKHKVLAQEILTGQLLVETEDRRRVMIHVSDVLTEQR